MRIAILETNPNAGLVLSPVPKSYDNPVLVYLSSLAPGSRRTMRQGLEVVASMVLPGVTPEAFPWASLRYQHVTVIRCRLSELYCSNTANKILAAMRGVLLAAFNMGQMDSESYARAVSIKAVRGSRTIRGRAVTAEELFALIRGTKTAVPVHVRDNALIAVAYGAGLRRSELVQLDVADYDKLLSRLCVKGKGNKTRYVPVNQSTSDLLDSWICVRGDHDGPLFLSVNKAGKIGSTQLSEQAIYAIFRRLATRAKVGRFSPHDLRRTFVPHLLDARVDLSTVQGLAGHASITTTARYDRTGDCAKRRAVKMLNFPVASNRGAA